MKMPYLVFATCWLVVAASTPAFAQDAVKPADRVDCELHVWPTENYIGMNSGLLSGLGPIGAVADMAAHKGQVSTVKQQMRDDLTPDAQFDELSRIGLTKALKLNGYTVVREDATPSTDDFKHNPGLKIKFQAIVAKIKSGERLSASKAPCYAELVGTMLFYQKAMMYGSNLFGGWSYREFPATGKASRTVTGAVKNPLEAFPAKAVDRLEPAKLEVRDAYAKDFLEYVQKKIFGNRVG